MNFYRRFSNYRSSSNLPNMSQIGRIFQRTVPKWILEKNQFTTKPNIASFMNFLIAMIKIIGLALFILKDDRAIIYVLAAVDIIFNLFSWWLLLNDCQGIRQLISAENQAIQLTELSAIFLKLTIFALLIAPKLEILSMGIALPLIQIPFLLLTILSYFRSYISLYDSVFDILNLFSLALIAFNHIADSSILSIQTLALSYTYLMWAALAIFVNYFLFVAVLLSLEIIGSKGNCELRSFKVHLAASFKYLISSLMYRGFSKKLAYQEEGLNEESMLQTVLLATGGILYYLFYTYIEVWFSKDLDAFFKAFMAEPKHVGPTGLEGTRILKQGNTFFAFKKQSIMKGQKNSCSNTEEDNGVIEKCIVCYESVANCVSLNCLHAGFCDKCCRKAALKTKRCIICRQKISKIAIISQIFGEEFEIIKEVKLYNPKTARDTIQSSTVVAVVSQ